ncbi:MAG: DUF4139 domain-containing protein [Tannerella sp.]|jgi:hypothetical protein|nr:DUF4139 domain-containing protein [Tannerella sp.]
MKTGKFVLAIAFMMAVWMDSYAETPKTVRSKLNEVTMFFRGAELTHTVTASLDKGESELRIEGLSSSIDKSSLKIKASGGVVISSYEYAVDYLSEKNVSPVVRKLQDSIEIYQKKLQQIGIDAEINKQLIELLQKGTTKNVSGSEKGMSFDELVKTMDYYKTKSLELETATIANQEKKEEYEKIVRRLQAQLNQESQKNNRTSGVLTLALTSPMAVTSTFTISYYTASAGWSPFYDVLVESAEKPVRIVSKAKLRQTSGIDWDKVKLTLSTATPSNGKTAPLFQAWFLDYITYEPLALEESSQVQMRQNAYSYSKAEMLASAPMPMQNADALLTTRSAKQKTYIYTIDGAVVDEQTFLSLDPSQVKSKQLLRGEEVTGAYGQDIDGVWVATLKSHLDDYIAVADNDLNVTYAIDLPYSIPPNGKEQTLELRTQEVTANYNYYCAPKLDTETYLLAEIANPEKLNLLSGTANITYEGTYVGETRIDMASTQEKLTLTLGTDKRVPVKREKRLDFSSKKSLGTDIEQTFSYKITVRNNQNKPVRMTLKDQYPISTQKDIRVELILKETTTPTFHVEDLGVITWEEELKAGETKVYQLTYSVRYPKNKLLNL